MQLKQLRNESLNPQSDQLPVGLIDSLAGRALHRYRKGHSFDSCSSLKFFQAFLSQLRMPKLST